jgi:trehalose synthase
VQTQPTAARTLDDYATVVDPERIRRIRSVASDLDDVRVLHVNSTAVGGGVAELLSSLVPLFTDVGLETDWYVMDADERFFEATKSLHNGLQGREGTLTEAMRATYRSTVERNARSIPDDYDVVVLHDPQPLGMIEHLADRLPDARFVWRCHLDLTAPTPSYLEFVGSYVRQVDHVVFSREAYGRSIGACVPASTVIHPSIDPLAEKNRSLSRAESTAERDRLAGFGLDVDAPLIAQVSRFDPWKGQFGLVEAYRRVTDAVPNAQLVLAGGTADDDPKGAEVYNWLRAETADDPGVHLLTDLPDATVNHLQRRADVVVQGSLREGFGLVVSEALWKRTPVVGSNVGGIPLQIDDGENGYLVAPDDAEAVAERTIRLLADDALRSRLGWRGRSTVRERFLLPRQLLDGLRLFRDVLGRGP